MSHKFNLQTPLFALYSFANRRGWLDNPWTKRLFRETYFVYKKYYEDPFWRLIKKRPTLFEGGHVLDVGANIGYTAYCFAHAIDADTRVYAFEPEDTNFAELMRTSQRSSLAGRIVPIQKAVGADREGIDLWINEDHHGDHRILTPAYRSTLADPSRILHVETISIDQFARDEGILDKIRFIKMDIQGYELTACHGMVETLDANPEITVVVEYSPEHLEALGFDPELLLSFFRERGFEPNALSARRSRDILRPWDWTTMDAEGYMDILLSRQKLS